MIKYSKDTRYDQNGVATHDRCVASPPLESEISLSLSLTVSRQVTSAVAATELSNMKNMARKYGVIGIDEGQFVGRILS